MKRIIYFGPPGTGKTTTLLQRLEEELKAGVLPSRIAFLTFTRRARQEAVERVESVLKIGARDLPHFRTIHSMAYRALNLKDGDVVSLGHLIAFGKGMGLSFGKTSATEQAAEGINSQNLGDQLLAIDNLSRLRGDALQKTWKEANSQVPWPTVDQFARSYKKFKEDQVLLDFTDVLMKFAKSSIRLQIDVAFIDEAQDLSALQWLAGLQACEAAMRQYVAGDDDQAVFRWAGADVASFMNLAGERNVLSHSFRLPASVHALALTVLKRIKNRIPKTFNHRGEEGKIVRHMNTSGLEIKPGDKWLWLVRNRYLIPALRATLQNRGVVYIEHGAPSVYESERDNIYTWERLRAGKAVEATLIRDVYKHLKTQKQVKRGFKLLPGPAEYQQLTLEELKTEHGLLVEGPWFEIMEYIPLERRMYYRALLREHKTLKLTPQVQLETIHGAKGAEAPQVALFLEMSRRVYDESQRDPDDEHRVFYVGITRARETLHIIQPLGPWGYQL